MPKTTHKAKNTNTPFTEEENHLLKQLKEEEQLTWKQIKEYFPGRTEELSRFIIVRFTTSSNLYLPTKGDHSMVSEIPVGLTAVSPMLRFRRRP